MLRLGRELDLNTGIAWGRVQHMVSLSMVIMVFMGRFMVRYIQSLWGGVWHHR